MVELTFGLKKLGKREVSPEERLPNTKKAKVLDS